MKNGGKMGRLVLNLYVNPSGTYYYHDGLFQYLKISKAEHNEEEFWLTNVVNEHGTLIIAVAVDYFLVTTEFTKSVDTFRTFRNQIYKIKRLGGLTPYQGW